jgi:hypothetical protein
MCKYSHEWTLAACHFNSMAVLRQLSIEAPKLRRFFAIFPNVSRERRRIASYHTHVMNAD